MGQEQQAEWPSVNPALASALFPTIRHFRRFVMSIERTFWDAIPKEERPQHRNNRWRRMEKLRKRMEDAAIIPELFAEEGGGSTWYTVTDPGPEDRDHPVNVDVKRRIEACPQLSDQLKELRELHHRFLRLLPPGLRKLYLALDPLDNAAREVRDMAFYNVGVDYGHATAKATIGLAGEFANTSPEMIHEATAKLLELAGDLYAKDIDDKGDDEA